MTGFVGARLDARAVREPLSATLAQRWRATFTAPRRASLVRSGSALLLADGGGSLRAVRTNAPGSGLADWVSVPLPRGTFRPATGNPLFIAHGGAILRAREDLELEQIGTTGVDDASEVEAFGLDDDGAVLATGGRVWRIGHGAAIVWDTRAGWVPVLANDEIVVGTERGELVLVDAHTGIVTHRTPLADRVPFALGNESVWLHGPGPRLSSVARDGAAGLTVQLAAPFPHPLVGNDGHAVLFAGALDVHVIDLTTGRVEMQATVDAPEAWPLLLAADGRVVYRDATLGLRVLDPRAATTPMTLAEGAMTLGAHVHAGCLFVLEQDLENRQNAAIRCFSER